jgi:hypothetical protein
MAQSWLQFSFWERCIRVVLGPAIVAPWKFQPPIDLTGMDSTRATRVLPNAEMLDLFGSFKK